MAFSALQQEYLDNATKRWNIKTGATRSGKTFLDYAFVIPKRITSCTGSGLIALIGNTRTTLERNVLDPMRTIWGSKLVGNVSQGYNTVRLFGKKCHVFGADKISQVSKIQGAGIEYCYGDEVTTWAEDVFQMLKSRLDKPNSAFDGTCNPDSPLHWFKKFLESDADIYRQDYTIDDNPFLTPFFVEQLKKEYLGTVYYDRFILGKWTLAEGLVYANFDHKRHIYNEQPKEGAWYVSVDYGTINPFSAGLWCVREGKAYRTKELYYDSKKAYRQKTNSEYYSMLREFIGKAPVRSIIVDPSAAAFIEEIRRAGEFIVRDANNEVTNGIRRTAGALNKGALFIHESCENTIREFGTYAWDEKKGSDTPIKKNDHAMDEVRYFVNTIMHGEMAGYQWGEK
ncbi:MAG: PBSX family phage terminase large subunit [Christensenellaceae bacterium]